jgi:DNA-binding PadR family transcriptional regulator
MSRRPSPAAAAVLLALLADATAWRFGSELGRDARLRTGSLYLALILLSDRGLVETRWEHEPAEPRQLYRLTAEGVRVAGTVRTVPGGWSASGRAVLRGAW